MTLTLISFRPSWSQQDESKRMEPNGEKKGGRPNRLFIEWGTPSDLPDASDRLVLDVKPASGAMAAALS